MPPERNAPKRKRVKTVPLVPVDQLAPQRFVASKNMRFTKKSSKKVQFFKKACAQEEKQMRSPIPESHVQVSLHFCKK